MSLSTFKFGGPRQRMRGAYHSPNTQLDHIDCSHHCGTFNVHSHGPSHWKIRHDLDLKLPRIKNRSKTGILLRAQPQRCSRDSARDWQGYEHSRPLHAGIEGRLGLFEFATYGTTPVLKRTTGNGLSRRQRQRGSRDKRGCVPHFHSYFQPTTQQNAKID